MSSGCTGTESTLKEPKRRQTVNTGSKGNLAWDQYRVPAVGEIDVFDDNHPQRCQVSPWDLKTSKGGAIKRGNVCPDLTHDPPLVYYVRTFYKAETLFADAGGSTAAETAVAPEQTQPPADLGGDVTAMPIGGDVTANPTDSSHTDDLPRDEAQQSEGNQDDAEEGPPRVGMFRVDPRIIYARMRRALLAEISQSHGDGPLYVDILPPPMYGADGIDPSRM